LLLEFWSEMSWSSWQLIPVPFRRSILLDACPETVGHLTGSRIRGTDETVAMACGKQERCRQPGHDHRSQCRDTGQARPGRPLAPFTLARQEWWPAAGAAESAGTAYQAALGARSFRRA
jgi:hypothetical protein